MSRATHRLRRRLHDRTHPPSPLSRITCRAPRARSSHYRHGQYGKPHGPLPEGVSCYPQTDHHMRMMGGHVSPSLLRRTRHMTAELWSVYARSRG